MTKGPESADAPRHSRRAADVPVDAPARPRERASQQRARDRAALRADKVPAGAPGAVDESADPPIRSQLWMQQAGAAGTNGEVAGMSVEQALAAREALQAQARNQVAAMESVQAADPGAVDPELLAQQKALAERAAVLNGRTPSSHQLPPAGRQHNPAAVDPASAHNLAMVTPPEFVRLPGLDQPVMSRPPTSHVPVITPGTPKQSGKGEPAQQGTPRSGGRRFEVRRPSGSPDVRPSRILARADASASAPPDPAGGAKPVGARSAFGLDPLDVKTAGLGRTRRLRFVSLGIGGLGVIAVIISVAIIIGGHGS